MTITFHFKTIRILGLTRMHMRTIKGSLIFSRMISIHGETNNNKLINLGMQTVISSNSKDRMPMDNKMQLQDLKDKQIPLIQADNMPKIHLIHTIIKIKTKKTSLIHNLVEDLLSSNSQIKATSIQLMSQDTHKILIHGETLGMDKNLANNDKRIRWNKVNLAERILLTPREAHLRASKDNKIENNNLSNIIKISVIKVSSFMTNGIKAGVKINNSMVTTRMARINGRIISKIISNRITRKQLIKWIQINHVEIHSNQGNRYSNRNGKMNTGINIKVIKVSPMMQIREAVRITQWGIAHQGERRVCKEMIATVWKVDRIIIRISVIASTMRGRMSRIYIKKQRIILISGMKMMDKHGIRTNRIILRMILTTIIMRI